MSGQATKQIEEHRHDVALDDGTTVQTGPPIEGGAAEAGDELAGELGLVPGEEPQSRRIKTGGAPSSVALGATLEAEAGASRKAIQAEDPSLLPAPARKVWDRMFSSTRRYQKRQGEQDDRYAAGVAWRGIRQKYNLGGVKTSDRLIVFPGSRAAQQTKGTFANTVQGVSGGAWIVNVMGDKNADVYYERIESIPLPSAPGASVVVGHGPGNHRNILTVNVPTKMVSSQAGGVGPLNWVNDHQDEIYRVAKASHRYLLVREDNTKRAGALPPGLCRNVAFKGYGERGPHFTTDPMKATKRIAFGEVYTPFEVDLQGEYATEAEVETFAHGFMKSLMEGRASAGEMHARWLMPDGSPAGIPVESFIVRRGDPDFKIEGAWVAGTEYHPEVWKKIATGEYRGYSIGGRWGTQPIERRAN